MNNKNAEGYRDPTAAKAIRKADKSPKSVRDFRKAMELMCTICNVKVQGEITVVDEKGRRW